MYVKDCVGTIRGELESHVLMLCTGMDPDEIKDGLKICHNHRKNLGQNFYKKIYGHTCHYPHHAGASAKF